MDESDERDERTERDEGMRIMNWMGICHKRDGKGGNVNDGCKGMRRD